MSKIKSFFDFGLDFLFPADETIERIKNAPPTNLRNILPASEKNITDTDCLFRYSDEQVKHLVWEIKYYKNEKIADSVATLLAERIKINIQEKHPMLQPLEKWRSGRYETFLVVPIPQTSRRFRERGFHHTKLIAELVVKNLPANFVLAADLLKKVRNTPKQSSIENRADRFVNIFEAFSVSEESAKKVFGANVIILDDVITTGATVGDARRALLAAGVKSVQTFAIAH